MRELLERRDGPAIRDTLLWFALLIGAGLSAALLLFVVGWIWERIIHAAAMGMGDVKLAVSLGQVKTLIENPSSMTHSSFSPEEQRAAGIEPGGIRLRGASPEAWKLWSELWHEAARVRRNARCVQTCTHFP